MFKFAIILAALFYGGESANFLLYTRAATGVKLPLDDLGAWIGLGLLPRTEAIILIHGHNGSPNNDFNRAIREQILHPQQPNYNIIVVDWEQEARNNYDTSYSNVDQVARELQGVISSVHNFDNFALNTEMIHIVGFHLGAHIAGIASRSLTVGRIARITGLDPAGTRWGSNSKRLRESDALYVEVIHTDGSGLLANGIGTNIGGGNFHVNGGSNQPGCLTHTCSHNRAYEVFAASINNDILGLPCNSMTQVNLNLCRGTQVEMGGLKFKKTLSVNGLYRVKTGRNWPYQ